MLNKEDGEVECCSQHSCCLTKSLSSKDADMLDEIQVEAAKPSQSHARIYIIIYLYQITVEVEPHTHHAPQVRLSSTNAQVYGLVCT